MNAYVSLENGAKKNKISAVAGEICYVTVNAYGLDANHTLTLRLTDGERVLRSCAYFIHTEPTEVCLPFVATGEELYAEVLSEDGGSLYSTLPTVEKSPYEYNKTRTGTYLVRSDTWLAETVEARDSDGLINGPAGEDGIPNGRDRTLDCVVVGDYMYAICNGKLHTLKRDRESFCWIGATKQLGELRQMAPTSDGKGLIVTARNFGLYTFDISDPKNPAVAAHVDSLEMATGLDVFGKFLYVADRTFGVDIIDVSDIYNPVFVSNIPTGETQDVCYNNGYVYAGVWGECKVRICDVRNVDEPREICEISLSGRGDGVFVKDGILYAATGQFPLGAHKDRYHPEYGLGNGLEIWDVHNPLEPKRLSVIRADGASYPGNPDLWRVYTSGKYLFFTSVHCGAYVYDVSDKSAPKRLAEYQILSPDEPNGYWTEKYVFPHQKDAPLEDNKKPYPIVDTYVDGDRLYLCAGFYNTGNNLYEVRLPFFVGTPDGNDSDPSVQKDTYSGSYYRCDPRALFGESARSFVTDAQIRAVAVNGDRLYLAAGARGVIVLDKRSMREIYSVPSFDITKDVKVKNGYLYTAESTAGVAVYKITDDGLTLVGQSPLANVVQLELSPDGRFAVAHISNVAGLVDLRDKASPKLYYLNREFHMVYQYQISIGCIANRYLAVNSTKGKLEIYDFGEGGSLDEPRSTVYTDTSTPITGMCADGDKLLFSSGKSVYRMSPDKLVADVPLREQAESAACDGMLGMPNIVGDYLFTVQRRSGKYNILRRDSKADALQLERSISLHANPCVTVFDGERYYLPLGYGGLISFVLN